MTINILTATRLNWYRDSKEWKPFHHDAAAIKPDKAKTQNLTVAVSFGAERDAAFEHAKTKSVVSMPQPNGTIYVFAKDVNIIWRHGILQVIEESLLPLQNVFFSNEDFFCATFFGANQKKTCFRHDFTETINFIFIFKTKKALSSIKRTSLLNDV